MKPLPRLSILLLLYSLTYAAVQINEVAWSGTPTSSNDEWIELFNDGEEPVSLDNWTLTAADGTPDILLSGEIGAQGFFLLERTDDSTVPGVIADQIYTGALSNTGEELVLKDAEGNEVDRTPAGTWPAGMSEPDRRSMIFIDNEWQTFEGDANEDGIFGSPGMENVLQDPGIIFAEPTAVRITEISPVSIGEPEWLEIEIFADNAIDLQNWKIKRGISEISFSELTLANGGEPLETSLNIWVPNSAETPLRFVGNPSPVGLPDDGGTLEILNQENEIVTTASWDETRNGTSDGYEWGDIWNWDGIKYWPWRSTEQAPTHTRGEMNRKTPVFPDQIEMRFEEIAPNRIDETDFIELLVTQTPHDAILPPWNVKHNGTELFASSGERVNTGDRITLFFDSEKISDDPARWLNQTYSNDITGRKTWESSTKNGLNKASGTLELNIWTGTSWEQTEDFVCWAEEELSEGEQERVDNHPDDWTGTCFLAETIIPNESLARFVGSTDTNRSSDFFNHFNGSPEIINLPVNTPPIPRILVQGGRRVYETSLNLTGLEEENATIDPDGAHDLKLWQWEIEGTSCGDYETNFWEWSNVRNGTKTCAEESARDNPGLIYFNFGAKKTFSVTLTVEDFSGAQESITVELNRDPFNVGGGTNVFGPSLNKWMTKEFSKESIQERRVQLLGPLKTVDDHFFDDFLAQIDYTKTNFDSWKTTAPAKTTFPKTMRDRIPMSVRSRLKKNIGLLFLY